MRAGLAPILFGAKLFRPSDIAAVKYWLDAGSIAGVSNGSNIAAADWRDKSQSLRGALAAAIACTYRAFVVNGRPAIEFDGSTSYCRSPSFAVAQPVRVFMVAKQITWNGGGRLIDGVSVNKLVINQASNTPQIGVFAGVSTSPTTEKTFELGNWGLIDVVANGASSSEQVNRNTTLTGNPGSNGYSDGITLGTAGNLSASFFSNYQLAELIICDGATLTAAQATAIRSYLFGKYSLVTKSMLVTDGDSLTAGMGVSAGQDYPSVLQGLAGGEPYWRLFNGGTSGQTLADMQVDAAATIDGQLRNYAKATLIAWGGTNDLQVANVSAATLESRWTTYAAARQTAGWTAVNNRKFVAVTLIDRGNWSAQNRTDAATFNTWLRANYSTYCTGLLDLAADSRFQNSADTTYYSGDTVHLTVTGYATVASLALPFLS